MFKDVYYLLKNNLDSIPLDKLYEMSLQYEIIPYVYYILYHTGLIFEDTVLQQYITAFKTDAGEALINCYGLQGIRHLGCLIKQTDIRTKCSGCFISNPGSRLCKFNILILFALSFTLFIQLAYLLFQYLKPSAPPLCLFCFISG